MQPKSARIAHAEINDIVGRDLLIRLAHLFGTVGEGAVLAEFAVLVLLEEFALLGLIVVVGDVHHLAFLFDC